LLGILLKIFLARVLQSLLARQKGGRAMKNQKGEVVTAVMVVMMVGMMIFGMSMMHGGHKDHGDRNDPVKGEQKHEHAGMGPQHMQHDHGNPEKNSQHKQHDHGDPERNSDKSETVETK
jgi:hypothetical protein